MTYQRLIKESKNSVFNFKGLLSIFVKHIYADRYLKRYMRDVFVEFTLHLHNMSRQILTLFCKKMINC